MRRAKRVSPGEARTLGTPTDGNLALPVFAHGTLEVEFYEPRAVDPQQPHRRDEIYVVVEGSAQFFDGVEVVDVSGGAFIFVPAGVEHRFSEMSDDFAVWVFFYGPEGGESED